MTLYADYNFNGEPAYLRGEKDIQKLTKRGGEV